MRWQLLASGLVIAGTCIASTGCVFDYSTFSSPGSDVGGAAGAGGQPTGGSPTTTGPGGDGGGGSGGEGGAPGGGGSGGSAVPRDCAAILADNPSAVSDIFKIDPDGEGGDDPYTVRCEMMLEGGGWTRFHWFTGPFAAGTDPLGQDLKDCNPTGPRCFGKIPPSALPTGLLVVDRTDNAYAAWTFDGSAVSDAMIGALRDKVEVCITGGTPFDPFAENSDEAFCVDQPGGCDAFYYTNGNCNGATSWALELDDDAAAQYAAFKFGATPADCSAQDWGYLNEFGCSDEDGSLYYR